MSQFNFKFYYGNQGSEVRELELLRFTGHENISQLFDFDLELKSHSFTSITRAENHFPIQSL